MLKNFGGSATCRSTLRRPLDDAAWQRLFARPDPAGITIRGSGASYSDAALNDGGTVALSTNQPKLRGWDRTTGILDVDGGVTLAQLLAFSIPQGWTLPVVPGTAAATVAGAFAADVHGKNHRVSGSFSSCVQQLILLSPGRGILTVGPQTEPDIFWSTAGGLGLTGMIARLRLRLTAIPTSWLGTSDTVCTGLTQVLDVMRQESGRHDHVVAWIDGLARRGSTGRGVVSTADYLRPDDLPESLRAKPLGYRPRQVHLGVPATGNLIRPALVRTYNALRFNRAGRATGTQVAGIPETFQPLDAIDDWPVLFGRRGLVQYQFAVPTGQEQVLQSVLEQLAVDACPPVLVTLKMLGAPSLGHLSFPFHGWTLALDFPAREVSERPRLFERLDAEVSAAGGRIYLVKDMRLNPGLVPRMYPRLDEWRDVRDWLDPAHVLTSDLDRRLDLSGHTTGARR